MHCLMVCLRSSLARLPYARTLSQIPLPFSRAPFLQPPLGSRASLLYIVQSILCVPYGSNPIFLCPPWCHCAADAVVSCAAAGAVAADGILAGPRAEGTAPHGRHIGRGGHDVGY